MNKSIDSVKNFPSARRNVSAMMILILWLPLSVGVMFWSSRDIAGLSIHHFLVLPILLFGMMVSLVNKSVILLDKWLAILACYVVTTGALTNYDEISFWMKAFAFIGVIVVSNHIALKITLRDFIRIASITLKIMLLLSIAAAFLSPSIAFTDWEGNRVFRGIFVDKNTMGRLCYFVSFLIFSNSAVSGRKLSLIDITCLILSIPAVFFTHSRTSQLVLVIMFLVFFASGSKKLNRYSNIFAAFLLVALCLMIFTGLISILDTGSNNDYLSVFGHEFRLSGRSTIWMGLIDALNNEHKWLFGFGLGGFYGTANQIYITGIGLGDFIPDDGHNGYLDAIVNIGILGLLIYCIILAKFFGNIRKTRDPGKRSFYYSILVLFIFSNFSESFFVKTSNISVFFLLLSFVYSGNYIRENSRLKSKTHSL